MYTRTGHQDGHVGRSRSCSLLVWSLTKPGLKRENEGDPGLTNISQLLER